MKLSITVEEMLKAISRGDSLSLKFNRRMLAAMENVQRGEEKRVEKDAMVRVLYKEPGGGVEKLMKKESKSRNWERKELYEEVQQYVKNGRLRSDSLFNKEVQRWR